MGSENGRIAVLSLQTGEQRVLVEGGTFPQYVSSGHLVYARTGGLLAVPFDLKRLEVTGPPVSILEGVSMNPASGAAEFSLSSAGLRSVLRPAKTSSCRVPGLPMAECLPFRSGSNDGVGPLGARAPGRPQGAALSANAV